jgi:hydroxymethylglutaryl-CoA lyase
MASTTEIFENVLSQPPASSYPIAYNYLIPNLRGLENLISILDRLKPDPSQSKTYLTPPSIPLSTQSNFDTTFTPSLSPF